MLPQCTGDEQDLKSAPCTVVSTTKVTFLSRRYKIVFSLDASISTFTMNHKDGGLISEDIFATLKRCFCGLLRPFKVRTLLTIKIDVY